MEDRWIDMDKYEMKIDKERDTYKIIDILCCLT